MRPLPIHMLSLAMATQLALGCAGDSSATPAPQDAATAASPAAQSEASSQEAPTPSDAGPHASAPAASDAGLAWAARHRDVARAIADFLVRQQNGAGALPDYADGDAANEDSNMEYALLGLGAAYAEFREPTYLAALEGGIRWLAARVEMTDPEWRGSFRYQYATSAPYAPIATSPGAGIRDVRGVDTTSALFVYLLGLHARITGNAALAQEFAAQAKAALNFVLTKDRMGDDPFTYSSWQQPEGGTTWQRYEYQYAADQGDVYLGLRAGAALYESGMDRRYAQAAQAIVDGVSAAFFLPREGRFAVGRSGPGAPDESFEGFNGVFAQGYLGWVFGNAPETESAYRWLAGKATANGSLVCFDGDPRYTLSASTLVMAARRLGKTEPVASVDWLAAQGKDGQLRDSADPQSSVLSNCAGFALMALLGFEPF
jgi:hypothetical protein